MSDAPTAKKWKATHKFARISPRKVRLIVDMIRHRDCNEALDLLRFANQRAGVFVDRVLRSAMANADEAEADMTRLVIEEAKVDGGPYLRRWRPKDRGRAHPIAKRTSHIMLTVVER